MIALDFPTRQRVILSMIACYRKAGKDTSYLQSQAWRLVRKMVDANEQNLATALGIELECQGEAPVLGNYVAGYRWCLPNDRD
jgi:hypothetical protein